MILVQKFKLTKEGKEKKNGLNFREFLAKEIADGSSTLKALFMRKKPGILDFESTRNDLKNPILKRIVDEEEMYILVKLCFLLL